MTTSLLSQGEANKLDNDTPNNQLAQVGERIKELQDYGLIAQRVNIVADATGGFDFIVNFSGILVDIIVRCTVANASGDAQLRRVTTAISDAITMAVDDTISRAATLTDAGVVVVAGETLNILCNGAADRGEVTLVMYRT